MRGLPLLILLLSAATIPVYAQDKPAATDGTGTARVFITDSQSWEMYGSSAGSGGTFGGSVSAGARPQTAEIIKTFGERCPGVMVNNIQGKTDYIVLLDHEGGKGILRHKNKVAVFARVSGDSIVSKSTLSLGGSVQDACEAISNDWAVHGSAMRAAAAAAQKPAAPTQPAVATVSAPTVPSTGKLSVISVPDGADIEVDGGFVGNTPSDVQVLEGDHSVSVKKVGFKNWERKLKVTAGSSVHLSVDLEKLENP
jgi:PEGA domain